MKEATGELNATIVVVLAVSVLIAFFYYTLWPIIKGNFNQSSQCSKAICEPCKDSSGNPSNDCKVVDCYIKTKQGKDEFKCVYKG